MKTKVVLPPPGIFQSADQYSRKWWRRVQHLANEFWCRWRKEFLHSLQERQKWTRPRRNLEIDDIVIIKDENVPRNHWKLARVAEVIRDDDGLVRRVKARRRQLPAVQRRKERWTPLYSGKTNPEIGTAPTTEEYLEIGNPRRGAFETIQENIN